MKWINHWHHSQPKKNQWMSSYRTALCNSPSSCLHSPAVASDWIFDTTSYVMILPIASTGTKPVPSSTWISWCRSSEPPIVAAMKRWKGGFPVQFRSFAVSPCRSRSFCHAKPWGSDPSWNYQTPGSQILHRFISIYFSTMFMMKLKLLKFKFKKKYAKVGRWTGIQKFVGREFPRKINKFIQILVFSRKSSWPKRGDATLPKCNGLA